MNHLLLNDPPFQREDDVGVEITPPCDELELLLIHCIGLYIPSQVDAQNEQFTNLMSTETNIILDQQTSQLDFKIPNLEF
jgi:hypothetical protein